MSAQPPAATAFMPLFSMELLHQYLGGGAYAAFTVTPQGATQKITQRLGWAAAQMENTFTLYADPARAAAALKQSTAVPLNIPDLCYAIHFRDPDFARYTDLSHPPGHALSFTSTSQIPQQHHHLSAVSIISEKDLVPVQTRSFLHPFTARGNLWLGNLSGEKILQLPAPERDHVAVDISALDVGFYRLFMDNKIIYSFIKIDRTFILNSHALLSIPIKQMFESIQSYSVNSISDPRKLADAAPPTRLAFPVRSTIWRYDFFNHGGTSAQDYAVVPAEQAADTTPPVFQHVEGIKGLHGETSLAFESCSPIPLAAHPGKRYALLRRRQPQPLIAELPTPGLDFSPRGADGLLRSSLFIQL